MFNIIIACLCFNTLTLQAQWIRNTFPSSKHVADGEPFGRGWDHIQAINAVRVSPLDSDFIVFTENVNATIITEDGKHFRPLPMPVANSNDLRPMHLEFSKYDKDTFYFLIVPGKENWDTVNHRDMWPMGVWRTQDRGVSWEHIYRIPDGEYERINNAAGKAIIQEDPINPNIIYFGTTSHGIIMLEEDPVSGTWEDPVNLVPEFEHRRIKTIFAAKTDKNTTDQTILYVLVEKKMPDHVNTEPNPLNFRFPNENFQDSWYFENNLESSLSKNNADLDNTFSGSLPGYSKLCVEARKAGKFEGSTLLSTSEMTLDSAINQAAVSVWIKTKTTDTRQMLVSYNDKDYYELGIRTGGKAFWNVRDSNNVLHKLASTEIVNDGNWHNLVGRFDNGEMTLHVDGEQVASASTSGISTLGTGVTKDLYIGGDPASSSDHYTGLMDNLKIYKNEVYTAFDAQTEYLWTEKKGPLAACEFWRVIVDSSTGSVVETFRIDQGGEYPSDDFNKIAIELDSNGYASNGWAIRLPLGNIRPYGGRQIHYFTNWGNNLTRKLDESVLEGSTSFIDILVNPDDPNHIVVWSSETLDRSLRYSFDKGVTWAGGGATPRATNDNGTPGDSSDDYVESLTTLMARQHELFDKGQLASDDGINKGQTITFIPDTDGDGKDDVIWFHPTRGGLMRSRDGGETFVTGFTGGPMKETAQLAIAPTDPANPADGNDYMSVGTAENGIVFTRNAGQSWISSNYVNEPTLSEITTIANSDAHFWGGARFMYGIAYHPADPKIMVGCYTDEGYLVRSTDGGLTWSRANDDAKISNNYCLTVLHPNKDNRAKRCVEGGPVYWSQQDHDLVYCGNRKSIDGGLTWPISMEMQKFVIAMSPTDDQILVGVDDVVSEVTDATLLLYISVDGGDNWHSIGEPTKESPPGSSESWHVAITKKFPKRFPSNFIAIDPTSTTSFVRLLMPGRSGIYTFTTSVDGSGALSGKTWTSPPVDPSGDLTQNLVANPHYIDQKWPYMAFVAFDPRPGYEHIVYAAAGSDDVSKWKSDENPNKPYPGGVHPRPLHMSQDGGATWHNMHDSVYADFPQAIVVKDLTVSPKDGKLHVVTAHGLYSLDMGSAFGIALHGVGFEASEGFYNGNLNNHPDWTENTPGTFVVDPYDGADPAKVSSGVLHFTGTGKVTIDSETAANWKHATLAQQYEGERFIQTIDFSINPSDTAPGSITDMFSMELLGSGGTEKVRTRFKQNTTGQYVFDIFENVGTSSSSPASANIPEADLGIDGNNTESDRLRLTMVNTYTGADDKWDSTLTLTNLDSAQTWGPLVFNDWVANSAFTAATKQLRLNTSRLPDLNNAKVIISRVATESEDVDFDYYSFSAAEGFSTGSLGTHSEWTHTNSVFDVDAAAGTLTIETADGGQVPATVGPATTSLSYTQKVNFSVTRGMLDNTTNKDRGFLGVGLMTDPTNPLEESLQIIFGQRKGVNRFFVSIGDWVSTHTFSTKPTILGTTIGISNDLTDPVSVELQLVAKTVYLGGIQWSTTVSLRDLTNDVDVLLNGATELTHDWDASTGWETDPKEPGIFSSTINFLTGSSTTITELSFESLK